MKIIRIMPLLATAVLLFAMLSAVPSPVLATAGNNRDSGVSALYDDEPAPPPPLSSQPPPGGATDNGTTSAHHSFTLSGGTPPTISTQLSQTMQPSSSPPSSDPAAPGHHPPGPGPHPPGPGPHPPYPNPNPNPYPYTYPWGQWPYYWRWSQWIAPSYTVPTYVEPIVYAPVISSFTADPNYVQPGESTVLTWNITDNPTNVTINPSVGSVPATGVYTVQPGGTTTYTLTAGNSAGSVTASTTVTVAPLVTSYYPTSSATATTAAPATTVVTTDSSFFANPWWLAALIGLLALAAVVIVLLVTRKPSPAMAVARTSYPATNSVTTPAADAHTTPVSSGVLARLTASGGGELGLAGGLRSLGRSDFRPMLTAGKADLISRQHIQVDYRDGVYYIEDRSSTNGTRLNGEPIRGKGRYILKDGDTLDLADVLNLTFRS